MPQFTSDAFIPCLPRLHYYKVIEKLYNFRGTKRKLILTVLAVLLLLIILVTGYVCQRQIITKLSEIKEYTVSKWFDPVVEYGKPKIIHMKAKLDWLDEEKLQKVPFMKQHLAALDFLETALMACKALLKRVSTNTALISSTGNVTATGSSTAPYKEDSGINKNNGKKFKIQEVEHIAIPSNEDVISNVIEIPEWACDEKHSPNYIIYCQGELLHAVMMLNIFKDSKTFVDKPLKRHPADIAADFKKKFPGDITANDREAVRKFIEENFEEEGHEMEDCELVDWEEKPEKLLSISDPQLRQFALNVNFIWKSLCRSIKKDVMEHPERHSLLYVPHEFVVPGGRFREFYYWDTYWVIKGLLASGMQETSRRMILNFEYLIKTIGFIPNGGRVYYLRRSQPPLFIPMVYEYYMATEDSDFLRSMIDTMEMEFNFWKLKRMINVTIGGKNHSVFYYRADSNVPR
ncbi:unnamed protein product [Thelazia callipaeda]|uniref:Trehalase n=1 Tax=Thelazia callipaeda TaxID=103827 RepID=A0A0N5CSP2_THECL|nr:unnamed protein product [Thelazia callipaeda]